MTAASGSADAGSPATSRLPLHAVLQFFDTVPAGLMLGLRIWLTMVVALGTAFWFQLESASSAAVVVGILAMPTRGQALSKGFYAFLGTLLGFAVSLVLAAAFGQIRVLLLGSAGLWLAACVFAATYSESTKAYGAALSGFTVGIIAISNIDAPQKVFEVGIDRVASVTTAILAVAFVNNLFASPASTERVRQTIEAIRAQVRSFVAEIASGKTPPADALVRLTREVTPIRPDLLGITPEYLDGRNRADGACQVITALANQITAAADLARILPHADAVEVQHAQHALEASFAREGGSDPRPPPSLDGIARSVTNIRLQQRVADLIEQEHLVDNGLAALDGNVAPTCRIALPVLRDFPDAMRNATRVAIAYALTATIFILSGWSATSAGMLLLGSTAAMAAINPAPKVFAQALLIGMPINALSASVVQFGILGSSQGFPILALAMAPHLLVGGVLLASPKTTAVGFILVVFFAALLAPSNPPSFDPTKYINTASIFLVTALLLALTTALVLPTGPRQRRRWMLNDVRDDLRKAFSGATTNAQAASMRGSDRLASFVSLFADRPFIPRLMARGSELACLDVATVNAHRALQDLERQPMSDATVPFIRQCRTALAAADARAMHRLAENGRGLMASDGPASPTALHRLVAELATAAELIDDQHAILHRLQLLKSAA